MFYTISSYCNIVVGFEYTILVYYYYFLVLYGTFAPYLIMCDSSMKQNSFFPFVLILTPIKPLYIPIPLADLSVTPPVTNVRYIV